MHFLLLEDLGCSFFFFSFRCVVIVNVPVLFLIVGVTMVSALHATMIVTLSSLV